MALIDVHVDDESVINLLRREKALRVGDGSVDDITVTGGVVHVTLAYELDDEQVQALVCGGGI